MQDYSVRLDSDNGPPKPVISRGARACTVCRAAKMKCVGAEDDGAKPCQRCRRSNSECIFEKHRRGRKPGSKLSEASKLLRKIEKSSASPAKIKSMPEIPSYVPSQQSPSSSVSLAPPPPPPPPPPASSSQSRNNLFPTLTSPFPAPPSSSSSSASSTGRFHTHPVPPHLHGSPPPPPHASSSSPHLRSLSSSSSSASTPLAPPPPSHRPPSIQPQDPMEEDDDDDDEKDEETMYPAKMVELEGRRHNFFGTVLTNPIPKPSPAPPIPPSSSSSSSSPSSTLPSSSSSSSTTVTTSSSYRRSEDLRHTKDGVSSTTAPPASARPPRSPPPLHLRHHHNHHHHQDHNRHHPYSRDHLRSMSPNTSSAEGHQHPSSSSSLPSTSSNNNNHSHSHNSHNNPSAALRYFSFLGSRLQNPAPIPDPVKANLLSLPQVDHLFRMIFLRLNPFINLFDPALHTHTYVRETCPFLFTVLCMAGCKFFMPEKFRPVQRMAEDLCLRAFQESWKRIEVVQAFMCMTYWREPDDQRTWTFIGYAARMAVELGLNTYYHSSTAAPSIPPAESTELHRLQRRNRERTYLVLWVHDRSLSMQTGRQWMLPEDDLVRNAVNWYREGTLLPIDTVVAAQVELRRIAASVIDIFYLHRPRSSDVLPTDVNYDVILSGCNTRLQFWSDDWMSALKKTNGGHFHRALLTFFKLHVRLFLNSFGLQSSFLVHHHPPSFPSEPRPPVPNILALSTCYSSASDTLQLVAHDFVDMLRYGQDSITVMTAYSAVFLLKLLRNVVQTSSISLGDNSLERVYDLINAAADAYEACAKSMTTPSSNLSAENGGQPSSEDSNTRGEMETDPPSSSTTGDVATSKSSKPKHGESVPGSNNNNNSYDNPLVGNSNNISPTDKSTTSAFMMVFSSVEYHGRFLRTLVLKDRASRTRAAEREKRNALAASGATTTTSSSTANTNTSTNATTSTGTSSSSSNDSNRKSAHGGVSRISTSMSAQPSGAASSTSTLVVSPTTKAAATALLGGAFSSASTKGLNGLAAVAANSSSVLVNGANGSSSSPRHTGEIIIPSSSSSSATPGSGNGTPTRPPYHHQSSQSHIPSPYAVHSTSSSHYRVHAQSMMNSHPHYGASQSQPISAPHANSANLGMARSSTFSHVLPHQSGSSTAQIQSHAQHVPVQQSTMIQQQPYNAAIPGHPPPTWHFPASPHLPAHPLVSLEDELQLETPATGATMVATSNAMYHHSLNNNHNNTANTTTAGRTMNSRTGDGDTPPGVDGGHSNAVGTSGVGVEGLPPDASEADVYYWNYMHWEMGYGNGVLNPPASVGAGVGSIGGTGINSFGITNSSAGMMNMEMLSGGGDMSLANINSGVVGNNETNAAMGVMNALPGLTVPSHASLGGLSGITSAGNNNNMPDNGTGSSVPEEMGQVQAGTVASPSSDVSSKHRMPATASSMGYNQHHGMPHSQTRSSSSLHGSTSHHISSAYHPLGHHAMQNG